MNLVWHIIKKDLTRLRLPLLLWTGLLLGQMILCERLFAADNALDWYNKQGALIGLLLFLSVGIGYILVAMLVLEDTLVGTEMFWVTRPISGGRLLAAKLLGAVSFFMIWPVLVGLPWWLWSGLGASDLGQAAVQTALMQTLFIVPGIMLAAIAGQSSRFLLWSLVVLMAVPVGTMLVGMNLPKDLPRQLIASRALVAYLVGLLTAAGVIWLQYRSRRLVRSIAATLAGAGAVLLVGLFWPWEVLGFWSKNTPQMPGTEAVSFRYNEAWIHAKDNKAWVMLRFEAKDVPENLVLLDGSIEVEFRWSDGTLLQRRQKLWTNSMEYPVRSLLNLPPARPDPATEEKINEYRNAIRQRILARGGTPDALSETDYYGLSSRMDIPIEMVSRFTASPPACTVRLHLEGSWPVLLMELPLKEGASRTAGGVRLRVAGLAVEEPAARGQPVAQRMLTLIHSQPKDLRVLKFYLVDRVHGTENQLGYGAGQGLVPLPALPLRFHRTELPVKIPQLWRDDRWVGAPEWLEADTLAVVGLRKDGAFDRTLHTDRLKVVPRNAMTVGSK